ncbi:MAG: hypothetical protein ACON38_16610 [Akkermansiaceae bacterium]
MRKKPLIALSTIALILLTALGVSWHLDARLPRATAIIQIHPAPILSSSDIGTIRTGPSTYMKSEFEKVLSRETLADAVKTIHLGLPATDEQIDVLRSQLEVEPMRGSDFIRITAKHQSKRQAAKIANAVARAYVDQTRLRGAQRTKEMLSALDEELQIQGEVAKEKGSAYATLTKSLGIPIRTKNEPAPTLIDLKELNTENQDSDLALQKLNTARNEYLAAKEQFQETLHKTKRRKEEINTMMPSVTIHELAKTPE